MRAALPDQCKQKKKEIKINSNFIFNYDLNYSSLLFFFVIFANAKNHNDVSLVFFSFFLH